MASAEDVEMITFTPPYMCDNSTPDVFKRHAIKELINTIWHYHEFHPKTSLKKVAIVINPGDMLAYKAASEILHVLGLEESPEVINKLDKQAFTTTENAETKESSNFTDASGTDSVSAPETGVNTEAPLRDNTKRRNPVPLPRLNRNSAPSHLMSICSGKGDMSIFKENAETKESSNLTDASGRDSVSASAPETAVNTEAHPRDNTERRNPVPLPRHSLRLNRNSAPGHLMSICSGKGDMSIFKENAETKESSNLTDASGTDSVSASAPETGVNTEVLPRDNTKRRKPVPLPRHSLRLNRNSAPGHLMSICSGKGDMSIFKAENVETTETPNLTEASEMKPISASVSETNVKTGEDTHHKSNKRMPMPSQRKSLTPNSLPAVHVGQGLPTLVSEDIVTATPEIINKKDLTLAVCATETSEDSLDLLQPQEEESRVSTPSPVPASSMSPDLKQQNTPTPSCTTSTAQDVVTASENKSTPMPDPNKLDTSGKLQHMNILLIAGDVTEERVDAIVNSTNRKLDLSVGLVSRAISKAGGDSLKREIEKYKTQNSKDPTTQIAVTDAGDLPCSKIFHVCLPRWPPSEQSENQSPCEKKLCEIIEMCLVCASVRGMHRYAGTLFRFPLRTQLQADQSDISELFYSSSEMKKFLQMFVGSAGNLLLFCQNVKTVRMYHLPKNKSDPSKATLLVEVKKNIDHISTHLSDSVLKSFSVIWNEKCQSKNFDTSDAINERISISLSVFNAADKVCSIAPTVSKVSWIIAWVLGRKESAKMAMTKKLKGLLPIAAAAVPVCENQGHIVLLPLSDCSQGFYKEGHLFCFLPLPITIPLPLHINGAFAVTHDRKQLCSKSEDEKSFSTEAKWNEVLHSDAVPFSVIKLLEALKINGDIDPTSFYKLWPGSEIQYGTLVKQFHEIIVYENPEVLLYNGRWVCFQNALVLDPMLRFAKTVGKTAFKAFEYFYKGKAIVIDLPENILKGFTVAGLNTELKSHTLNMNAFYQDIFFPNISDPYWNNEDRDCLVMFALQHGNAEVKTLLEKTPCIPTRPLGTLKQPKDLVHPNGKTSHLFQDSDGVFPLNSKENNFCTAKILSVLIDLGMQHDELHWSVVYERVTSIANLCQESIQDAVRRCKYILHYLEEVLILQGSMCEKNRFMTCLDEFKDKIQNQRFLPILQKPENWPTVWCCNDENKYLGTPLSLCFEQCINITCSNTLVLDGNSIDVISTRNVLKWLGVQSEHDIPASRVVEHLLTVSLTPIPILDTTAYNKLSSMCLSIYFYLNKVCSSANTREMNLVFDRLCGKQVILQDKAFIRPEQMAFSLDYDLKPYLYKVDTISVKSSFLRTIGVRESFEPIDAANIMIQIADRCEGNALSKTQIHCYQKAASFLVHLMDTNEPGSVGKVFESLFLPDKRGVLHPFSELCLDDCEWLNEKNSMKFLHHSMSVAVAVAFGVKTKRQEDLKSHSVPFIKSFGQHEALTNRLKRILEGYPCDSSLMKELLQNADDAGATELMFIKDFRTHPCNRVFDDRWKSLQGPALCVYNNSYFTQKDLDGIQDLGLGSKAGDPLKTGQYGVGFNAVYHLTDVPTFLTVGPETEETLCVLDPNCLYTPTAEPGVPGARFDNIAQLRTSYRDVFSCFLEDQIALHPQGTLFRFPLRTEEMAKKSDISKKAIGITEIEHLLESFKCEMAESLLFLHNIRKISVASINENGNIEKEHVVEASAGAENIQKHHQFLKTLGQQVKNARTQKKGLKEMNQQQIVVTLKLKNSHEKEEQEWLVVHQFGFAAICDLPQEIDSAWRKGDIKLLPRGGVAARLDEPQAQCDKKAFCMLPLPIETGLPVHINGHFALDHEARRNLWHGTSDIRSKWNKQMVEALIVPAYLTALKQMQVFEDVDPDRVQHSVNKYNSLFPDGNKISDEFWKSLVIAFYTTVFHNRLTLFPVINCCKESDLVSWVSVGVTRGFPGYFNDLESYFKDIRIHNAEENKEQHNPGSSTFGSVFRSIPNMATSASRLVSTSSSEVKHHTSKALKLAALLKRIGMKVIEAPLWIYSSFDLADLGNEVHTVNPENVITFLKSCSSEEETDRCFVGQLPQPVDLSPFGDSSTVRFVITFCQNSETFGEHIIGLPLCLTNSSLLRYFSSQDPILVTKFTDLIQGSPDACLHKDISDLFLNCSQCPAIKKMDIRDLCQLLDKTLDAAKFKQGTPVEWNNTEQLPTKIWIKKLWTFLFDELQNEFTEGNLSISKFQELREWSLLLCSVIRVEKDITKSASFNQLYPLEKAEFVVNLEIETSKKVVTALKTLGLPCFNSSPFLFDVKIANFASSLTANLKNPHSMLVALSSHKYEKIQSTDIACTLLEYFRDNLNDLQSVKNEAVKMLKALPFFVTLSRSTLSLVNCCRPVFVIDSYPYIPRAGLDDWSSQTGITVFRSEHALKELYTFMNITALTSQGFYSQYLLPQFECLPTDAKAIHLLHIKNNLLKAGFDQEWSTDQSNLIHTLRTLPFIEKTDGTLCRACEFVSSMEIVFEVMCPTKFPPQPYGSSEWHDFLVLAGMIDKVSVDHFVRFANEVHILGKEGITIKVANMSNTLIEHLFNRPNLMKENLLSKIKHIKFVLPFCIKDQHKHGKTLDSIHKQFENGSQLIAFSGSVSSKSCYLGWSNCTLHPELPYFDKKIFSQLGCQYTPKKDDVIVHLKNISVSLKKMNVPVINGIKTCLEEIMHSCYQYLKDEGVNKQDKMYLEAYPVIYLNDVGCMVRASDVVINLEKTDAIPEYIYQSPLYFGQFFSVFENLGVSKTVSANHYAKVLIKKHLEIGENKLIPNDWMVVQKAVDRLFKYLSCQSTSNELSVSCLYLPSSMETLVCAKDLVLSNSYTLQKRVGYLPLTYFIGFDELNIPVFDHEGTVRLLPEQIRPHILTSLVQEHVTAECQKQAYTDIYSDIYMQCITSSPFVSGVIRIVNHQSVLNFSKSVTEVEVRLIEKILQNIQIHQVNDLKTNLIYSEEPVAGSEEKRNCFLEFIPKEDENVLYLDTHACTNKLDMCNRIAEKIDRMVRGKIGNKTINLSQMLQMLQMGENDISSYLDNYGVLLSNFQLGKSKKILFPPPGTLIPEDFHWMLDNNFESLKENEYIGLEVYDPMLNETDEEGETSSLNSASTSSMESSDAVYIYAIVRDIIEQNVCPMMSKYCVEVGEGRTEELNATKLYKFCRHKTTSSQELVLSSASPSSPDLNDVLKEIRQTLKNAWLHLDELDRQRVVKRLYLKWHPDKNDPDQQQLCTSVCQYIQFYVAKLNRGESIDDTEEKHSWTPPTFESSWFFTNMDRRSESQSNCYHSYQQRTRHSSYSSSGSYSFHSATRENAYPHLQEAKRWLRQATVDLEAAKKGLSNPSYDAFNWICFKSHQAAEKALKALLYNHDARRADQIRSHDLRSVARTLQVSFSHHLSDPVNQLESLVCDYNRMRYPDRLSFPQIPSDVYSRDTACNACRLAGDIVQYAGSQIC
ncbi:sacsin-like [Gigantopelta aegis]|uniref:sacsin-like n=1 Tax=Gigantopelta aegis TaxID=1735272 RepID=UPI001B88746B|nr:sacsin-like [Gigantopelta aegis]